MESASSPAALSPARGRAARCGGRAIEAPDTALFEGRFTCNSPPCGDALLCPTSFAGHGGIEDNWRESRSPLLAQGGVAAPIKKMPRSLLSGRRRGGWFKPPIIGS